MMTPTFLAEDRQDLPRGADVAHEVELEGRVPVLVADVVEAADGAGADVVDEDVDLAARRRQKRVHSAGHASSR